MSFEKKILLFLSWYFYFFICFWKRKPEPKQKTQIPKSIIVCVKVISVKRILDSLPLIHCRRLEVDRLDVDRWEVDRCGIGFSVILIVTSGDSSLDEVGIFISEQYLDFIIDTWTKNNTDSAKCGILWRQVLSKKRGDIALFQSFGLGCRIVKSYKILNCSFLNELINIQ